MTYSLIASCLLLALLALAVGLPCWWLVGHYRNRSTIDRVLDAWLTQTRDEQARRYRFWYRYGRLASRSRRVWAIGCRRFQRRFRSSIPLQAVDLADAFLVSCWRSLVVAHRFKRAHRCARKTASYGL